MVTRAVLSVFALLLVTACTGRTSPASVVGLEPAADRDAGAIIDTGVRPAMDAAVSMSGYAPCQALADCPSGTVRCTLERAGICNPPCEDGVFCPDFDGREGLCVGNGTDNWCILTCREDDECPDGLVCTPGGTCVFQ